ncbi:RHS repeat-associated core domain-containing protein [Clostridium felsineum]|uniref:RHS repeat-associated core domain-containing protein n=1 Tax=Clostridium felsineum TaxID=36839 RepID=UPI00214D6412|nr:RHS repeat-associated core domain-containing protein [Clostridium felsineum]MCR3758740.1 RHS repeat-associated core domain-containing protein [Clostridium felsineum]
MNLNGSDYYYIKDAAGIIIGLIDKSGIQVVSYTYDSFGKLIAIDGSLKDTVGQINPYRYKSYRYDSETGLYYLQSRYYNPEWGRFINADSITANQGELLSGNMFAYCENNPVNKADVDGNIGIIMDGDQTVFVVPAGIGGVSKFSATASCHSSYSKRSYKKNTSKNTHKSTWNRIKPDKSQVKSIATSAVTTGVEGTVSSALSEVPKAIPLVNNVAARRAGLFLTPMKDLSALRAIGKVEKVGLIGAAFTAKSLWDDWHSGYGRSEEIGRTAIDAGSALAVIGLGFFTPIGVSLILGVAVGAGVAAVENGIWKKE